MKKPAADVVGRSDRRELAEPKKQAVAEGHRHATRRHPSNSAKVREPSSIAVRADVGPGDLPVGWVNRKAGGKDSPSEVASVPSSVSVAGRSNKISGALPLGAEARSGSPADIARSRDFGLAQNVKSLSRGIHQREGDTPAVSAGRRPTRRTVSQRSVTSVRSRPMMALSASRIESGGKRGNGDRLGARRLIPGKSEPARFIEGADLDPTRVPQFSSQAPDQSRTKPKPEEPVGTSAPRSAPRPAVVVLKARSERTDPKAPDRVSAARPSEHADAEAPDRISAARPSEHADAEAPDRISAARPSEHTDAEAADQVSAARSSKSPADRQLPSMTSERDPRSTAAPTVAAATGGPVLSGSPSAPTKVQPELRGSASANPALEAKGAAWTVTKTSSEPERTATTWAVRPPPSDPVSPFQVEVRGSASQPWKADLHLTSSAATAGVGSMTGMRDLARSIAPQIGSIEVSVYVNQGFQGRSESSSANRKNSLDRATGVGGAAGEDSSHPWQLAGDDSIDFRA